MKQLPRLNFPYTKLRIDEKENRVFDTVRKKQVLLTPEEWVRQHVIEFLIDYRKFPKGLLAIERKIKYNQMDRRCDIVAYGKNGKPRLIVECKAPDIRIDQSVFDQIARYNMSLQVNWLMITNGIDHYYCHVDLVNKSYKFIEELPDADLLDSEDY